MATGGKDRSSREARQRARIYRARQELHLAQSRRRRRDNLVAAVVGGVITLAAIGAQIGYFTVGPGAPEPAPAPAPTTSVEPGGEPTPQPSAPVESPAPAETAPPATPVP